MRKKLILLTCVLLCLTLFVGVLVACDPDSAEDGTQTPGDATKPGDITTPGDDTTTPGGDEQGGTTTPDDDTTIPDDDTTTPEETEEGAWWAYGETEPILGTVIGKGIVRFVSDTQWEMEVMDDCMYGTLSSGSAETKYGRMWCTGEYEFVGEPGEGVLRMRIVPDMPYLENGAILDPTSVRICGADGGIVLNGEWVEYTPDEEGVYNIKIAMHSSQAEGQISSEQGTINFHFMAPNFDIEPGYYYDDEQEYLDSLSAV